MIPIAASRVYVEANARFTPKKLLPTLLATEADTPYNTSDEAKMLFLARGRLTI
jgi:hypothetical protein